MPILTNSRHGRAIALTDSDYIPIVHIVKFKYFPTFFSYSVSRAEFSPRIIVQIFHLSLLFRTLRSSHEEVTISKDGQDWIGW